MDIKKHENFKSLGESNKTQIVLGHTSREIEYFIYSLYNRRKGHFIKIPNYIISRVGVINEILPPEKYAEYSYLKKINETSIIILLENLGWLEKEPLKNHYINWIGDIYKGKTVDRKWRDYYHWEPYSDIQIEQTAILCKDLMRRFNIPFEFVGHNTKVSGVEKFSGILTKSNFDGNCTDLSPAFNFDKFKNYIYNE